MMLKLKSFNAAWLSRSRIALLSAAVICSLSGCSSAPRGLAHKAYRPAAVITLPAQDLAVSAFAFEVSTMADGEERYFAVSPLGSEVYVKAQPFYYSALGEHCRKASARAAAVPAAQSASGAVFAVCELADGGWYYHQPIISDGSLQY